MGNKQLLFIDIELSGMRAFDEVIEFAAFSLDLGKSIYFEPTLVFDGLISGATDIHWHHKQLTGIDIARLSKAEFTISDVIKCISSPDTILVSYGLQFDVDWIYHSAQLNSLAMPSALRGICLLKSVEDQIGYRCSLDRFLGTSRQVHRAREDALLHWNAITKIERKHLKLDIFTPKTPVCLL